MDNVKKVVIKVGTSTLTYNTGLVNIRRVEKLVKVISDIANSGKQVVLVTSGAVGVGKGKLGIFNKDSDMATKQAAAAVGQCELMYLYDNLFSVYNHTVAQILLTKEDVDIPERYQNVVNTFTTLFRLGAIPIVNENDTISTEEIVFGDNDTLSAYVAKIIKADLLVIMSDIDGLYDSNPAENKDAKMIKTIKHIDKDVEALAGGAGSRRGTGGMITKLHAGKLLEEVKINMVICSGEDPDILYDVMNGKDVGTLFDFKE